MNNKSGSERVEVVELFGRSISEWNHLRLILTGLAAEDNPNLVKVLQDKLAQLSHLQKVVEEQKGELDDLKRTIAERRWEMEKNWKPTHNAELESRLAKQTERVRLAIEALEGVTRFTRVRQGLSAPLYEIINVDELYKAWNALIELKKEIGE